MEKYFSRKGARAKLLLVSSKTSIETVEKKRKKKMAPVVKSVLAEKNANADIVEKMEKLKVEKKSSLDLYDDKVSLNS